MRDFDSISYGSNEPPLNNNMCAQRSRLERNLNKNKQLSSCSSSRSAASGMRSRNAFEQVVLCIYIELVRNIRVWALSCVFFYWIPIALTAYSMYKYSRNRHSTYFSTSANRTNGARNTIVSSWRSISKFSPINSRCSRAHRASQNQMKT